MGLTYEYPFLVEGLVAVDGPHLDVRKQQWRLGCVRALAHPSQRPADAPTVGRVVRQAVVQSVYRDGSPAVWVQALLRPSLALRAVVSTDGHLQASVFASRPQPGRTSYLFDQVLLGVQSHTGYELLRVVPGRASLSKGDPGALVAHVLAAPAPVRVSPAVQARLGTYWWGRHPTLHGAHFVLDHGTGHAVTYVWGQPIPAGWRPPGWPAPG